MGAIARWSKRIGLGLLAVLAAGAVGGAIYEQVGSRSVARDFPPPGKLVDIGGRKIHLDCRGSGRPVVVFEAGLDSYGSLSWSKVHDEVAKTTRACAYDRAGIMWSDKSPDQPTAAAVARDLHAALRASGEPGPYVMVGHSFAGPWLTVYTNRYRADVAGLVFVDTSHPAQQRIMKRLLGREIETPFILHALVATRPIGIPRLLLGPGLSDYHAAPAATNRAMSAHLPSGFRQQVAELEQINATLAAAEAAHDFGDRPLIVLTGQKVSAGVWEEGVTPEQVRRFNKAWLAMQADQAGWSTHGKQRIVADATHYLQFDRPDAVIEAVREVVEAVRTGRGPATTRPSSDK